MYSHLCQIGKKYGTDKVEHQFTKYYSKLFECYRNDKFNFLEVGVFFGSSIRMWNEYFPNATIYGADTFEGNQGNGNVFKNADQFYNEWKQERPSNIELMVLDQSSETQLKLFVKYCKENNIKFKIIIDDGSHLMYDQQITMFYLWDLIEDGGVYVIEDIHTSHQTGYDVNEDSSNTTKLMLTNVKLRNRPFRSKYINDDAKCDQITNEIGYIDIFSKCKESQSAAISKKNKL